MIWRTTIGTRELAFNLWIKRTLLIKESIWLMHEMLKTELIKSKSNGHFFHFLQAFFLFLFVWVPWVNNWYVVYSQLTFKFNTKSNPTPTKPNLSILKSPYKLSPSEVFISSSTSDIWHPTEPTSSSPSSSTNPDSYSLSLSPPHKGQSWVVLVSGLRQPFCQQRSRMSKAIWSDIVKLKRRRAANKLFGMGGVGKKQLL